MDKNHDVPEIFEKFSETARRVLITSQKIANSMNSAIDTQHLLIALTVTPGTISHDILQEYMVSLDQIRLILSLHGLKTRASKGLTTNFKHILEQAVKKASQHHHITVDSEHLLLAITLEKKCIAYQVIERIGIDPLTVKKQIETYFQELAHLDDFILNQPDSPLHNPNPNELGGPKPFSPMEERMSINPMNPAQSNLPASTKNSQTPALDYFTTDLTKQAKDGKLDPIIGRSREITRAIQILCRRTKNNIVLVGEPGVGKTAIAEGLAQRIAEGKIPALLSNKRLAQLDLALLVAGTTYRGQFEDRVKKVVDEIVKSGNVILFVDELHTLVGAGSAEGSLDLANILKPALAKGQIHLIGATTLDEYRKHIEKDTALERRLQQVLVEEPSPEEAIEILRGIREPYEKHHRITISDDAIIAAVYLSRRYISDRYLPDKAIDLVDEAAASTHLLSTTPNDIEEKIKLLEKEISRTRDQKEKEVEAENYEKAMRLKAKELKLTKELQLLKKKEKSIPKNLVITKENIAQIVSQWTGVPVTTLVNDEKTRLLQLESVLRSRIVGQEEAITTIAKAIRRSKTGVADSKRPLGSFIFLGPTGVGKTELAKVLAEHIYGREDALIKVDMSEFMERHNVSRLIGAPPGYVGYEESGKLTEAVRKKPYSVILFDEIEKAHPEVFNILLQILEDGYLSDAKGRRVNFRNTIIILTSNIGMAELNRQAAIGFHSVGNDKQANDQEYDRIKEKVTDQLKQSFRPEFLNRLDKVVIFRPLNKETIRQIVDIQIEDLRLRLASENIKIDVADEARNLIAEKGFDQEYGARPIRRAITEHIEDPLSEAILENRFSEGQIIRVLRKGDNLVFRK